MNILINVKDSWKDFLFNTRRQRIYNISCEKI